MGIYIYTGKKKKNKQQKVVFFMAFWLYIKSNKLSELHTSQSKLRIQLKKKSIVLCLKYFHRENVST